MQRHPHCAGLPETHFPQAADRERAGGLWHPVEQETSRHHLSEEGQGRSEPDNYHLRTQARFRL